MQPLFPEQGGSVVTLDFDAGQAWPGYDWMGVSKAALESVVRYLAHYLGPHRIRVNAISAGPIYTTSAKGIPGFPSFPEIFDRRAPLGWGRSRFRPLSARRWWPCCPTTSQPRPGR
jgi:enoyl ACP reductase